MFRKIVNILHKAMDILLEIRDKETTPQPGKVLTIPIELMNAVHDRSAGRYCAHCEQHGSHHTDAHNSFADAALYSLHKKQQMTA